MVGFFWSSFLIKFLENILEVFKVRNLVLQLFLLKLKVIFNFAQGCVNKNLGVTKIF